MRFEPYAVAVHELIGSAPVLVVIDANVFVSAAIQRGASHRIIESWLNGTADFEVVMCPQLLGEIREVLTTRPRLRKWISLQTATLFVDTIETLVDLVDDPNDIQAETRDPNDDYLIALARTNDVEVIVSGDKDLLDWEPQQPPVVTPAQFEQGASPT
jgi:putative PIN family toxin of toxin-antitoxin system